ncbi:MAG TPA: glycerophosphodiester phosphodiesterase [Bryobacteraceae bacterium]|jgi:glycerophosphoryl diester phosphodiesterase|nr:glycerophosphodiester phosphodiesterase [Bryobacteraceae bacterium]
MTVNSTFSRRAFTVSALAGLAGVSLMSADKRRILVHGHRGARARRPENTIPAFQYAIGVGVDVLELDVAVTKDNVAVVSHDPHINATICSGPNVGVAIHDLTLEELHRYDCGAKKNPGFPDQQPQPGTRVPTLDEVLALGKGNSVQFNVETKIFADHPELTPAPEPFAQMILDLVRKHKLESRVILQSFDPRTLRVMKRLDPSIPRAALWEEKRDWMEVAKEFDATLFSPAYRLVTPEYVAQAHAAGMQVVPWTADKPSDWQKLADAGVDAIITDDPATLIAWLKERGLR